MFVGEKNSGRKPKSVSELNRGHNMPYFSLHKAVLNIGYLKKIYTFDRLP
jgi:hypothetical protein